MSEKIRFHFDPLCPWCYQTSRWVRRLSELGELQVDWAVFSLDLVNADNDDLRNLKGHARSARSLRTVVAVREQAGSAGVERFYAAIGKRHHEDGEPIDDVDTVKAALGDAGLEAGLTDAAMADPGTWGAVTSEHTGLVERTRSFGVPTIVLDGGDGPAIFGPVISLVPDDDEEAIELWRHVAWLTRYDNFSELKRERTINPDLPAFHAD